MPHKYFTVFKSLSWLDFIRKVINTLARWFKVTIYSKIKSYYHFKNPRIKLGRNVRVSGISFNISVGDGTNFYDNCIFEFGNNCAVEIGSNVVFSYGVLFCCREMISIGNDVQIGEYTSVRDSTHDHRIDSRPMKYASDIVKPIFIRNNVWIGRGCIILPGSTIEEGVVVAANSVVGGHLKKNGVYGGAPARFLKWRLDHNTSS